MQICAEINLIDENSIRDLIYDIYILYIYMVIIEIFLSMLAFVCESERENRIRPGYVTCDLKINFACFISEL